ncbi:MAG: radical SAM protein, partial [Armatimonadetes bacterium]|nr:radical SAM protein [Armatimonadota bacterium]
RQMCIRDRCRRIVESGREFTVSSLRLEMITPEVARLLAAGGQRTLTIAPEAGTERLRCVIAKHCTDEQIRAAIAHAWNAGMDKVKLYFMIGLPTETDEDAESIAKLLLVLAAEFPGIQLQASVSSFVPKPWTPFQWHPMERENVLKRRYAKLLKEVAAIRGVTLSGESPRLSTIQGLLARGDRLVGRLIEAALENNGDYRDALRQTGIDTEYYLYRHRSSGEIFPWDHIEMGIDKEFLWNQYEQALRDSGLCS